MSKKLKTPIIKPRTQGGTFYTFGSAMEDIGLNINSGKNIVELSHYVLLDIPHFLNADSSTSPLHLQLLSETNYSDSSIQGDCVFADSFQNYCLNFETVVRNQDEYNYSSYKTVSERAFWKWLFRHCKEYDKTTGNITFNEASNGYFYQDPSVAIAKAYGSISAGAQRTDDSGLYNETFVQIPASYGQMQVLFKQVTDENYYNKEYNGTNGVDIENLSPDEKATDHTLKSTGISFITKDDIRTTPGSSTQYNVDSSTNYDKFEVEFDINKLSQFYNDTTITSYDDIGMGKGMNDPVNYGDFSFNAILVYYSVYDSTGKHKLATNAYGLYILDSAVTVPQAEGGGFYFPSLLKKKSSLEKNGSSYSFRLNIKTSTAYSGDITVNDNSTAGYSMSEDFNDVLRNLTDAIKCMKENAKTLYTISKGNNDIKTMVSTVMEKVDNIEEEVNNIKNGQPYIDDPLYTNTIYKKEQKNDGSFGDLGTIISAILYGTDITYDNDGRLAINIDTFKVPSAAPPDTHKILNNLIKTDQKGQSYVDLASLVALLIYKVKYN